MSTRTGDRGRRDRGHGSERCHESSRFHHLTMTGRPSRNGPRPKPLVLGRGQRRQRNLLPVLLGPVNRSPWFPAFLLWDGPALMGRTATDRGVRIGREDMAPTDARTSPRLRLDRDQQSAFPVNTDFHQPGNADRFYVYVDIVTATDGPGYGSRYPASPAVQSSVPATRHDSTPRRSDTLSRTPGRRPRTPKKCLGCFSCPDVRSSFPGRTTTPADDDPASDGPAGDDLASDGPADDGPAYDGSADDGSSRLVSFGWPSRCAGPTDCVGLSSWWWPIGV